MENYRKPNLSLWKGRKSDNDLYLHEKIRCIDLNDGIHLMQDSGKKTLALLGYACDEGVRRNFGRIGAIEGPDNIRRSLAKMSNHLDENVELIDVGNVVCEGEDMESTQKDLSAVVSKLLYHHIFPIVLGGGHDIVYGHYHGIKKYLAKKKDKGSIGVINLDAHFDLRTPADKGNSGTSFYQIATESAKDEFHYLCLGIQRQSNIKTLFETAGNHVVTYLTNEDYCIRNVEKVREVLQSFLNKTDHIYLTIDLDGFTSAIAPGVSAPSPFGFSTDIVLETLKVVCESGKLISLDIAEINPSFDVDTRTARLAAGLIVHLMDYMINGRLGIKY